MIDIRLVREDIEAVVTALARRGVDRADIDALAALDRRRRELLVSVEQLRAQQKEMGRRIGGASPDDRPALIAESKDVSARIEAMTPEIDEVDDRLTAALLVIPNLPHPDAPDGVDDSDAVELSTFGTRIDPDPARDHVELGEALGIIDGPRGVKVSGSRFAFLLGDAVLLQLGLVRYAIDRLMGHGHTPVVPPVLTRAEALRGTGFLPSGAEQIYEVPRDELFLVGTSEVPLAAMHGDEILDTDVLPLRYAGISTCFRREAGTYGKDTSGIFRVHQFDKVEMFTFCRPEESTAEHQRLLDIEVELLSDLGLHGRVVDIPVGDLGDSAQRKYDVEVWLPGQGRYRELTSTSNCTDYQARRLAIRHRHGEGDTELVHTLNGTAVAVGRTIIALMETHQRPDGTIAVPDALVGYVGREVLGAPTAV